MAINATRAKKLCTKSEFELVKESAPTSRREMDAKQLKSRATLARKFLDKYRGLGQQQSRTVRGKTVDPSQVAITNNANTSEKEAIFAEVLERFESQLRKLQPTPEKASAAPPKKKAAAKKGTAPASKKRPSKKAMRVTRLRSSAPEPEEISPKAPLSATAPPTPGLDGRQTRRKAEGKQAKRVEREAAFKRSGTKAVAGHISSRGRRTQATRDQRNG
jgi:hypothetical protein